MRRLAFALCALLGTGDRAIAGDDWEPVAPERLGALRGGFVTAAGLQVSLGIEREVSVNGQLISRTNLYSEDLRGGLHGPLSVNTDAPGRLFQNGPNNFFLGSLEHAGSTVIQNTLSHQAIRTQTQISANVNSGALLKDLNFNNSVRDAALHALGTR